MNHRLQRVLFGGAGVAWMLFGGFLLFLLWQYLSDGAGAQFVGLLVSPATVLLGLLHVFGFCAGAGVSVAVALLLWTRMGRKT